MKAIMESSYEDEVYDKLRDAEVQAHATSMRFSHEDVMTAAKNA